VAAVALLAGCGSSSKKGASSSTTAVAPTMTATVVLKNIAFTPKSVALKVGGTVTWEWQDGAIPHNVTFTDFKSGTQTSGTYDHQFPTAGTFTYECTIHTGMKGTVTVS